jgi:hypothetical protein
VFCGARYGELYPSPVDRRNQIAPRFVDGRSTTARDPAHREEREL